MRRPWEDEFRKGVRVVTTEMASGYVPPSASMDPAASTGSSKAELYAQALRDELVNLWSDLAAAYRASRADPREASMGCENLIGRIHTITALVGPISTDQIEMPFLLTGMYEQVHAEAGIAATVPEETLQRARDYAAGAKGATS